MKVKFECEKCGHEWIPSEQWSTAFCATCDPDRKTTVSAEEESCPNCAKLTYGPLTVDLIAEFLNAAGKTATWGFSTRFAAEGVLRLLNECESLDGGPTSWAVPNNAREWLLDLATRP